MGGLSETHQSALFQSSYLEKPSPLIFSGTINTNGGGFASIRANLPKPLPHNAEAIRLIFRGDGKTYKILLSDGKGGGPFSETPSWQADIPTRNLSNAGQDPPEERIIPLSTFQPSFGGRGAANRLQTELFNFHAAKILQLGLMLSLKLSDGRANPTETFGTGVFDFKLEVQSIELIVSDNSGDGR